MASTVLKDVKVYNGGLDVSGVLNACALTYASGLQDATTFGNDTRINKGGLKSVRAEHQGYWESDPGNTLFSNVGSTAVPTTICPTDGSDGEVAFIFEALHSEYSPGGDVGSLLAFSVSMDGGNGKPLVNATILQPAGAETATGTGTGRELGAVSSSQSLYGALHVISASGTSPTLDVVVESDDNSGFTSGVTRLTFDQQTAVGSDWQSLAGALTDTHYRVSFTIGGTDPSFSFIVAVGIA